MRLTDIVADIKQQAKLAEIITHYAVGEFPTLNYESTFRGVHGTHGSSSRDHCEVNPVTGYWRCFSCHESGSVIDWVLSVRYNGDTARFRDAVAELADYLKIEFTDSPIDTPRHQAYGVLTRLSAYWNDALLGNPETNTPENTDVLKWISEYWGLTRKTIRELGIGYAKGLPEWVDLAECSTAGVTGERGEFLLLNRVTFPFFKDAQVMWIAGRYVGDPPEGKHKYVSLFQTSYVHPILYNYDKAYHGRKESEPLIITEGLADAARAHQDGLRTIALGTTRVRQGGIPDLRRLCSKVETKYIILDSEVNEAGSRGARATAQTLVSEGFDPLIVELPRGGKPKVDLCSFLQDNSADRLQLIILQGWEDNGVACQPETLGDIAIRECPDRPESARLEATMLAFAALNDTGAGPYLKKLQAKTKIAIKDLTKVLEKLRKLHTKTELIIDEDWAPTPFFAQDFTYHPDIDVWRAHITTYVPCIEKVTRGGEEHDSSVMAAIYITVDQKKGGEWTITRSDKFANPTRDVLEYLPQQKVMGNSWSVRRNAPNSVVNFVEKKAQGVELGELYWRVYNLFDQYVVYGEPRDKHVLALFVFLTYIFMGFDAIPYLHANGVKNSGKSSTLQLLSEMCFNRVSASQLSAASAFRTTHNNRPTLIIDEAERLHTPQPGSNDSELLNMALAGYKKTDMANALRCDKGDDLKPKAYFTYCPKVFGSIRPLGDVLASRVIRIECRTARPEELRDKRDLTQDIATLTQDCQQIRDALHVWAITEFRAVRERYNAFTRGDYPFLRNRDRELWLPLLAIAEVVDSVKASDVAQQVASLAEEKMSQAKVAVSDFSIGVLKSLWDALSDQRGTLQMITKDEVVYLPVAVAVSIIRQNLIKDEDWDDKRNTLNAKFFTKLLRDIGAVPSKENSIRMRTPSGERAYYLRFDESALKAYLSFSGHITSEDEKAAV